MRALFVTTLAAVIFFAAFGNNAGAESLPNMRPALLGNHKRSLINLINTEALVKRGQGDAIVMFSCGVSHLGFGYGMQVFRGTPNSEKLQQELLARSRQAQFEPAVHGGVKRGAWIDGTVVFAIVDGKPRLRIFLNQEESELNRNTDFIAPQLVFLPGNTKYKGFRYPPAAPGVAGVGSVFVDMDVNGKVLNTKVTYEHPPNLGFGAAAAGPLYDANFIPAFRNGKPVPCRFTTSVVFQGPASQAKTG
ncbi:MAG: hypothetical protein H0W20_00845 [Chthoniobacterales bacterium]|nr:hypothetical protein [Chthoniobacterales bacterium]